MGRPSEGFVVPANTITAPQLRGTAHSHRFGNCLKQSETIIPVRATCLPGSLEARVIRVIKSKKTQSTAHAFREPASDFGIWRQKCEDTRGSKLPTVAPVAINPRHLVELVLVSLRHDSTSAARTSSRSRLRSRRGDQNHGIGTLKSRGAD